MKLLQQLTLSLLLISALSGIAQGEAKAPILVVVGGFSSCTNKEVSAGPLQFNNTADVERIQKQVKAAYGERSKVVTACHSGVALSGPIHFQLHSTGMARPVAFDFSQTFSEGISAYLQRGQFPPPYLELIKQIQKHAEAEPDRSLVIVGHSYGGWAAMLATLALPHRVDSLFTLDPISPLNCSPKHFLAALFATVPGCKRAPTDFSAGDLQKVRGNTNRWHHYYQTQFHRLHSSGIEQATVSVVVRQPYTNSFYNNAHIQLEHDQRIWQRITDAALLDAQPL